jgi:hypothetical protein
MKLDKLDRFALGLTLLLAAGTIVALIGLWCRV